MTSTDKAVSQASEAETAYVHDAFRIAVGLTKEDKNLLPPVPPALQRLFTRAEEYECAERDQWDNWEYSYSDNYKKGRLWIPDCDLWIQEQRVHLREKGIALEPLWPNGHQFAVCLTHDVDYIGETMTFSQRRRELFRSIKALDILPRRKLLGSMKGLAKLFLRRSSRSPLTTNTLEISYLIEKEFGVSASYFFTIPPYSHLSKYDCLYDLNDKCRFMGSTRKVKDVMSYLVQEGFDVGLHGSYFSAVRDGLLEDQKFEMEKAIQSKVSTTRQHWLHLHLPETFNLQEKAGFLADTTLGFNRNIGYRAGTGLPFFPFDRSRQQKLSLIEMPLVIQDGALVGENALEYAPYKAFEVVKEVISSTKATEGAATFLFHPDIFLKAGLAPLYRSIIDHCLNQNAWVADLNSIQSWWRKRAEKLS